MKNKTKEYGLYQTLSSKKEDAQFDKEKFFSSKTRDILSSLSKEQRDAIVMLIIEHSRVKDDFVLRFNDESKDINLPYEMQYKKESGLTVNFSKLPNDLLSIIDKFLNVIDSE